MVLERRRRVLLRRRLPLAEARRVVVSLAREPDARLLTLELTTVALRLATRVVVLAAVSALSRRNSNVPTVLIVASTDESGWWPRLVLSPALVLTRVRDARRIVAILGTCG